MSSSFEPNHSPLHQVKKLNMGLYSRLKNTGMLDKRYLHKSVSHPQQNALIGNSVVTHHSLIRKDSSHSRDEKPHQPSKPEMRDEPSEQTTILPHDTSKHA